MADKASDSSNESSDHVYLELGSIGSAIVHTFRVYGEEDENDDR